MDDLQTAIANWTVVAHSLEPDEPFCADQPATGAELRLILAAAARDADVVKVPTMDWGGR